MRIKAGREFGVWFNHVKNEGGVILARTADRILCWFPDEAPDTAVVALIGGDKKVIQDLWSDSATPRAEAAVDQWVREQARALEAEPDNDEEDSHDE